jgi:hypothetical protein
MVGEWLTGQHWVKAGAIMPAWPDTLAKLASE